MLQRKPARIGRKSKESRRAVRWLRHVNSRETESEHMSLLLGPERTASLLLTITGQAPLSTALCEPKFSVAPKLKTVHPHSSSEHAETKDSCHEDNSLESE